MISMSATHCGWRSRCYEFNTCRLTYRWMFERSERWNLGLAPMCDRSIHLVDGYIVSDTKN
ncbi:MAG: hypothetical protein Q7U82_16895 [Gammaproteobacteria bacterium]|nr:hypothetical protein [Gammaproteobacteria bacterium]